MHDWKLTRTLELDGTAIRRDCLGAGAPVVLLHGTPSHSFLWRGARPGRPNATA